MDRSIHRLEVGGKEETNKKYIELNCWRLVVGNTNAVRGGPDLDQRPATSDAAWLADVCVLFLILISQAEEQLERLLLCNRLLT